MKLQTCFMGLVIIAITSPVAHGEFIHCNRHVSDAQAKVVEIYYKNGNHSLHDRAYSDALYATFASLNAAMPHMYCVDLSRNLGVALNHQASVQGSASDKSSSLANARVRVAESNAPFVAAGDRGHSDSHLTIIPPPFRSTVADEGVFANAGSAGDNRHHLSSPFRENGQERAGGNGDRSGGDSIFGSSGGGGRGGEGDGRFGSASVAPEPTSLVMLAIGAAVLGGIGVRRAKLRKIRATT